MKVFDLHIGFSDAITQLKKDPLKKGFADEEFPNQFDFIRAKMGKLNTFCSMICPVELNGHDITLPLDQKTEIKKHMKVFKKYQKHLKVINTLDDFNSKDLKTILGLEGVYFLQNENDLSFAEDLINQGVKIFGVKWNFKSKLFNKKNKLTKLGKAFLKLCEQKNVVIDLAHSESDIIGEILANFSGSVIDSHTCLFSIKDSKRNIKDEFIKEIINRNGLIGITFVGEFVGGNSLNKLMEHFKYFIENFGLDNLTIGSDFDGMEKSDLIKDLEDVSKYKNIIEALKNINLSNNDIEKIFYTNAVNYYKKQYE